MVKQVNLLLADPSAGMLGTQENSSGQALEPESATLEVTNKDALVLLYDDDRTCRYIECSVTYPYHASELF